MLRIERSDASGADLTLIPTIDEQRNIRPSMLYHVLPTMVSNRIPTLPSLRRSLSGRRHGKSHSLTEIPVPATPPPHYTSRPGSGSATPNLNFGDTESDFSDDASERPSSSLGAAPPLFAAYETKTGISWKYASSGISLLTQAYRESSAPIRETDETSTSLARQLYIHGVTYLLRGLPAELSPEETLSLQAAVPQSIANLQADSHNHTLVPVSQRTSISLDARPQEPTILHRITATFVFQTFVLIQFLLPYIRLLLSHTYQFERKHQITKRLVNTSVTTVDELGRKSLRLSQTICQMNDGKVGQAINEMTIWWVRSVTGGVQQGLEEGLSAIGARSEGSRGRVTVETM
ncbi:Nn.00g044240.m01.CDS01 [Neocucurbitaria sp. VM-36]